MAHSFSRRAVLAALAPVLVIGSRARAAAQARVIDWKELLPASERGLGLQSPPASHNYLDEEGPLMQQRGSGAVNPALNGAFVRVPGFVVPLELAPEVVVSEFLLVPYYGACIHVPPPPPNQIVYVKLRKPARVRTIWEPWWITGTLSAATKSTRMAAAAYTLDGEKLEEYSH